MINRFNSINSFKKNLKLNYLKNFTPSSGNFLNSFTTTNTPLYSKQNSNNNCIQFFNNVNSKFVNRKYSTNNNSNFIQQQQQQQQPQPQQLVNNNHNNNNNNNSHNSHNKKIYTCKVISTSRSYKKGIENLPEGFILQRVFEPSNVRWLVNEESNRDVYIFPSFGCVVSWGITDAQLQTILNWLKPYEIRPNQTPLSDTYRYKVSNQKSFNFEISKKPQELLNLSKAQGDQEIEKFCSSYAFAQSVALFPLEDRVQNISDIVENISITGKINQLKKIEIIRQLGEQLLIKSSINLHSDFETPEFFWENTEGENIYNTVRSHCEIGKRIRIMNEKLNLITDIYDVINDEQKHKHSIRLERIIIFLIAMEIFITLLREFRDYYLEKRKEEEEEKRKKEQL
ncbi:hypothetical protein DICPUDRAFT_37430 [Dictyostelium purpureum]|uniref:DUF155 domain-containing protein n=1 Tax=Dictyostelium purpureum TaxID=5786 RepID=F0ZSV2_DICPU|nr:uncharacterized protein DICPUDRAFT_37430 [Dictyostelium purpureum]EGC32973.1 hypothetical protein DICPUDRAFT_37430 [Dictyostelium purpureum]|eukprot:XP_003290491.1 hypothetical protein DICPUDRAFT_37430 [Dictyostelium purpureum]